MYVPSKSVTHWLLCLCQSAVPLFPFLSCRVIRAYGNSKYFPSISGLMNSAPCGLICSTSSYRYILLPRISTLDTFCDSFGIVSIIALTFEIISSLSLAENFGACGLYIQTFWDCFFFNCSHPFFNSHRNYFGRTPLLIRHSTEQYLYWKNLKIELLETIGGVKMTHQPHFLSFVLKISIFWGTFSVTSPNSLLCINKLLYVFENRRRIIWWIYKPNRAILWKQYSIFSAFSLKCGFWSGILTSIGVIIRCLLTGSVSGTS